MLVGKTNILSIQALRAIAAILVVFCHSEQFTSFAFDVHMVKYLGQCFGNFGVDIFFVISGFIMFYINHDKFGKPNVVGKFLQRRLLRIFPIYWVITLFVLIFIIPSTMYKYALPESQYATINSVQNLTYLLQNFLLIPSFNHDSQPIATVIGPAWTLIYEMFFYYIFGFFLFFNKKFCIYGLNIIFLLLVLSSLMMNLSVFHYQPHGFLSFVSFYGNNIIFEFIFGCFLANRYLNNKFLNTQLAVLSIIFAMFIFVLAYHIPEKHYWELHGFMRFSLIYHIKMLGGGVPAALLLYGVLSLEARKVIQVPRFLIKLGNASYSIYLFHFPLFIVLLLAMFKKTSEYFLIPGDIVVLFVWLTCVSGGYLAYLYVEVPLMKWIKNAMRAKPIIIPEN